MVQLRRLSEVGIGERGQPKIRTARRATGEWFRNGVDRQTFERYFAMTTNMTRVPVRVEVQQLVLVMLVVLGRWIGIEGAEEVGRIQLRDVEVTKPHQ